MRVLSLYAENFLRLKAVEITPTENVVQITGANGQGKSSVLGAIFAALGGKDACPDVPVRIGEQAAVVALDLGDLRVERRFTAAGGTSLIVTNAAGARLGTPQKVLDELVGRLTFDPLEFLRQDPKAQADTLRALAGLDFTDLDRERQGAYDERTNVNREAKALEAQGRAIVVPPDAPDAEVDAATVAAEIEDAQSTNRSNKSARDRAMELRTEADAVRQRIATLEAELTAARADLEVKRKTFADCAGAAAQLVDIDEAPIRARLAGLRVANEAARAKQRRREIGRQYLAKDAASKALTEKIEALDRARAERLAQAKFPIEELRLDDTWTATYRNLPLKQASSAEQLRVSVAIAQALNPKLRILRITDGSLLDSKSLALLREMCEASDYQCWLETVDESGEVGVVISDGQVIADNQQKAAQGGAA